MPVPDAIMESVHGNSFAYKTILLFSFDVITLKIGRKPVKLQKENSAGCDGEGIYGATTSAIVLVEFIILTH